MSKKMTNGKAKQVKGSVKEALGKVIGNAQLEAEGTVEKVEGEVEERAGRAQEVAEDVAKKVSR